MGSALPVQEPSMDDILASIRRIIEGREDRSEPGSPLGREAELEAEGRAAEIGQAVANPAAGAKAGNGAPSAKAVGLTASNDEGKTPFAGAAQSADAERIASKVEELATLSVARMRAASLENAVRDYRETEMAAELQGEETAMDTQFEALSGAVPSFYDEFDEAAFASELLANAGLAASDEDDNENLGESARLNERRSRPAFESLQAPAKPASMSERAVAQQAAEPAGSEAAPLATVAVLGLARPAKPDLEEIEPSTSLSEAISILAPADAPQPFMADEARAEASFETPIAADMASAKDKAGSAASDRTGFAEGRTTQAAIGEKDDLPSAGLVSLVSNEVEGRISSSFDQLAEVVRADQLARMDDTVRDMLRPMLSDWLEDNLPSIVERMVREEIERVARGPRRA